MKKTGIFFLLLVAGAVVAPSCGKRLAPRPSDLCNISQVTVIKSGTADTMVFHLTYDRVGLVTAIQWGSGEGLVTRSFAYADTNMVVTTTGDGVTITDSVTLGSNGLMLVDVNRTSASSNYLVTDYFYSGMEVVNASLWYNGQPPGPGDLYEYTWSGGNLQIFVPQAGLTSTTSSSYTYTSAAAAMGDYFYITQLLYAPAFTVRALNQVVGIQQLINDSTISYSHRADGRISGMRIITTTLEGNIPPDTVSYSYTYGCELRLP